MKIRYYQQFFAMALCALFVISCGSKAELIIEDSDVDKLVIFIDEANAMADKYEDLTGPKGAEIFGDVTGAVCGEEHNVIGPCIWAIDDIVIELGYRDISEINNWMLDNGKLLYDLQQKNPEFDTQNEFITEVACAVVPDIMTRNQGKDCNKDNVVSLLNGALSGAYTYGTNYMNSNKLTKEKMYEVGSTFYKVWRFMINTRNCK